MCLTTGVATLQKPPTRMLWPRAWLKGVLRHEEAIRLACSLYHGSLAPFPFNWSIQELYVRNKLGAFCLLTFGHSIYWKPSWLYLLSLVYCFLQSTHPHLECADPLAWTWQYNKFWSYYFPSSNSSKIISTSYPPNFVFHVPLQKNENKNVKISIRKILRDKTNTHTLTERPFSVGTEV